MEFPKKSADAERALDLRSSKAGSSNGQSELRFDYASRESGGTQTGSASGSGVGVPEEPSEIPLWRAELWLRRISLVLFVVVCVWVGLILVWLPWTHLWTDNALLIRNLSLRSFLAQNFVRGVVSGLGLINVWMGIWEAVHYREPERNPG